MVRRICEFWVCSKHGHVLPFFTVDIVIKLHRVLAVWVIYKTTFLNSMYMFDSNIVDLCVYVCLSRICPSDCLYFVYRLSICLLGCIFVCMFRYVKMTFSSIPISVSLWFYRLSFVMDLYGKHASIVFDLHRLLFLLVHNKRNEL